MRRTLLTTLLLMLFGVSSVFAQTGMPTPNYTIDLATVLGSGSGYTFSGNTLTLTDVNGVYKLTQSVGTAIDRQIVAGADVIIILAGVNLSGGTPIDVNGKTVILWLQDGTTNT